ncbi:hypothetical protein NliqN6_5508 [Naganishia liquefaciens]|uniref:Chromate transporter n=1 Tax=Naganishia liquefaciens TaxID=104408 RepID=A0A8H3TY86_9TREE|nr:hypothetical protein NliqN6_5508 [Naganishia liquefaciens]
MSSTDVIPPLSERLADTVKGFWHLGLTAFGGPGTHIVILRRRFVENRAWVDSTTFADLFALGNALPGPGSTQLAFSIATVRGGMLCGLVAFLFWSIPGAAGMAGLAAAVRSFPDKLPPIVLALLTGLNASAVGLIALAAYQLSNGAVTDAVSRIVLVGSASFGICYHAPWMYPVLVASGGIIIFLYDFRHRILSHIRPRRRRRISSASPPPVDASIELQPMPSSPADVAMPPLAKTRSASAQEAEDASKKPGAETDESGLRQRRPVATSVAVPVPPEAAPPTEDERLRTRLIVPPSKVAYTLGASFIAVILTLLVLRAKFPVDPVPRALDFTTNMVIAGVIIFGGGPVVIPLLRGYTVENGWVSSRDFLLGFAILQAFPGPNFNFAVYLGVLCNPSSPVLGAFLGWLGIFSPGILLKLALLPLYNSWRKIEAVKSVLRGLNAAASGLVYVAVWQLFLVGYIYQPPTGPSGTTTASGPLTSDPWWGVVAAWSFVVTQWFKVPPALSIVMGGVAGLAWFGVVGESGVMRG